MHFLNGKTAIDMYHITKWGRYFAVMYNTELICLCVYKKGAAAVIERLKV